MMEMPEGYRHLRWEVVELKCPDTLRAYVLRGRYRPASQKNAREDWKFALVEDHGASWRSEWWGFNMNTWIDEKRHSRDLTIEQVMQRVFAEGLLKGYLRHAVKPNQKGTK